MTTMAPSTDWAEKIDPDEARRFEGYATLFRDIQAGRAKKWGHGRGLHRKGLVVAQGTLSVLDGLPEFARHGIFAEPRDWDVRVRLSNGAMDRQADKMPDIRGFALQVLGVQGESALGGPASTQDFTLINHEAFSFPRSAEFIEFVKAASEGNAALLKHLYRTFGVAGAVREVARAAKLFGKPFSGFATEWLHTALPMANGPYAVRMRIVPDAANGKPSPGAKADWAADFSARLREHPLHWDVQLQYYTDEASTPIEDASVVWNTPYFTVARLMLPVQDTQGEAGRALSESVENGVIDPWHALAEHRPLGEVQRARKVVYFASQQGRGAA